VRARQDIPTLRFGAQHGKVRRRRGAGMAETPVGSRRLGRRGAATARVTRGSRGRGVDGGAVQGAGSTAREPADRAQPRRSSMRDAGVRGRSRLQKNFV
jgi:hypothetical protein